MTYSTMDEFLIGLYMAIVIMLMRIAWKLLRFLAIKLYNKVLKKCCMRRPAETSRARSPPPAIEVDDPTYEVVQPHYYAA